jgi:PAS domain S-box-containing protein
MVSSGARTRGRAEPSAASTTWDEASRLEALDRYGILDTPREPEFDDIVRLAADVFGAPISVVNLIADNRQWFKAEVGIGADELPLDVSICAHAILQQGIFVVPDLTADSRFDRNPLVTQAGGLRFYAGALLETADGLPLGTVCVLDTESRPEGISERQRLTLEVLARQVMTQLDLRRAIMERDQRAERLRMLTADLEQQVADRAFERARLWQISPDLLSVMDIATASFDRVNPAWERTLGWSAEEIDGQPYQHFVHPEDVAESNAAFDKARAGGPVVRFENRCRNKAGDWRWLSWVAVPEGGKLYSTTRDVTDEKRQAEALAIATAERDRMWQTSPDLLLVVDFDGVFRRVNPAWTAVLGYSEDELVGTRVDHFLHPDDVELTERALADASGGALPVVENRYRHKDGTHRWISWITPPPENGLIYATGRHITMEKEREAELDAARETLRQSQKMEAVGQLTGGIAHDFNNMLAVVIGSLDLLNRRIGVSDAKAKRYVDAATDGARRAATLTQRLLAFSRQQPLKPESVDANKLVAGMSDILRHSLGGDVRLETVLAGGLWRTHA